MILARELPIYFAKVFELEKFLLYSLHRSKANTAEDSPHYTPYNIICDYEYTVDPDTIRSQKVRQL